MASRFFYAVLITLIVIFATIAVSRAADRAKKAEERLKEQQGKGLLGRLKD